MSKFPFKVPPMDHQLNALRKSYKKKTPDGKYAFGYFHGMGTGKTFTSINLAASRFMDDAINATIVLCPNPIKDTVWPQEFEQFSPVSPLRHQAGGNKTKLDKFIGATPKDSQMKVLVASIESLSQGSNDQYLFEFAKKHRCQIICDESSRLKNATSNRTKNATKISRACDYSLIMTGTPITQGVHDLYGQMHFLSPEIIGIKSWVLFRNTYCVMGGFEGRQIVGYRGVEELMDKIRPYVDVVRTEDVITELVDLPPRIIKVTPTAEQKQLIDQLGDMFEAQHGDHTLACKMVLDRLTRFQQIIGGHFPFNDGHDARGNKIFNYKPLSRSPKLEALMQDIEDNIPNDEKVVVWARFMPEIKLIRKALEQKYGVGSVVDFYGQTENRVDSNKQFKEGKARFMVANPQVGGMGQTWVVAKFEYYYSCSFSYEDREQAGRRIKRKGQTRPTLTTEIVADSKYDRMIFRSIKFKGGLASFVEEAIVTGETPDDRFS